MGGPSDINRPGDRAERRSGRARREGELHLTPREREVLKLVLEGAQNKDIAAQLGLREPSVKEHVSRLLQKFDVPNRAALADAGARLDLTGGASTILERAWFPQFFRGATVMIAVTSGPEHRYVVVNDAFARTVNRPVVGKTIREAFPDLTETANFEIADRVYRTGESFVAHEAPGTYDRGAGPELRYSDGVVQALRGADGSVEGLIYFGIDVTDLVRARAGGDGGPGRR